MPTARPPFVGSNHPRFHDIVARAGEKGLRNVSAYDASRSFPVTSQISLGQVEQERRSLVIEKRGTPRAVLLSIRDYVRLAAPEPEILRIVDEESRAKGTDSLSSREIDRVIRAVRGNKTKPR